MKKVKALKIMALISFCLAGCANQKSASALTSESTSTETTSSNQLSETASKENSSDETLSGSEIGFQDAEFRDVEGVGEAYYVNVRYAQAIYRFTDYVTTAPNARYTVLLDPLGRDTAPTKAVELREGRNTFYLFVENDVERTYETYTVVIYRNHMYWISFDSDGGSLVEGTNVEEGFCLDESAIPIPTKDGYYFQGWDYDFSKPIERNVAATALWTAVLHHLTILTNDETKGFVEILSGTGYTDEEIVVLATPAPGYLFSGWFSGGALVSDEAEYNFKMPLSDYCLEAFWEVEVFCITYDRGFDFVTYTNPNPYEYTVETETIVLADPIRVGYIFRGWYDLFDQNRRIESIPKGSFGNVALTAHFDLDMNAVCNPTLSDDGKTLTYGLYPQTHVNDPSLISSLDALSSPESNGWYLLDGKYYANQIAYSGFGDLTFDDGTAISEGVSYWFECEPIRWEVLTNSNGEALVVSSLVLDAHRYNEYYLEQRNGRYANNYKESEIRQWLNYDFFSSAFSFGDDAIKTTTVDNTAST
ncbi:MAG: InlB B-repeat-containing protein, partial [Bacilli bacterium]|nr:InlB B-repeat-containing protein [Bacilli bacterium]